MSVGGPFRFQSCTVSSVTPLRFSSFSLKSEHVHLCRNLRKIGIFTHIKRLEAFQVDRVICEQISSQFEMRFISYRWVLFGEEGCALCTIDDDLGRIKNLRDSGSVTLEVVFPRQ